MGCIQVVDVVDVELAVSSESLGSVRSDPACCILTSHVLRTGDHKLSDSCRITHMTGFSVGMLSS